MRTTWKFIMNRAWLPTVFAVAALSACNNGNNKTSDIAAKDTSMYANNSSSADSVKNAAPAKTIKAPKKGRVSIAMEANSTVKIVKDKNGVYNRAETMPEFPGGQQALAAYVENHLDYPQQAVDDNTTGTVKVSFVVDEKGKVMNPRIIGNQKIGDGLDEEAVKVVEQMPAWKPGKIKGKNVKTRLELPITFQLST